MFVLIIGIVVFFGVHLIPLTSVKVNLVERMGGGEKISGSFFNIFLNWINCNDLRFQSCR